MNTLARLAGTIGEPARAAMLLALLDGRAYTAGELAGAAGITASTASTHLALLADAGLLLPRGRAGIAITDWPGRRLPRC